MHHEMLRRLGLEAACVCICTGELDCVKSTELKISCSARLVAIGT